MSPRHPAFALLAAVTIGACEEPYEPQIGSPIYEGEHFDVWASEGLEVCGGTFDHMEHWLASFRALTGPQPTQERHRFYWTTQQEMDELEVCTFPNACVRYGRSIYSVGIPADHETVHAELNDVDNSFLSEGAAEAYADRNAYWTGGGWPDRDRSIEELISQDQLDPEAYDTAGHFTRFLIDRIGLQPYIEWMQASGRQDDLAELGASLDQRTGESLSDLVAEYDESFPSCSSRAWRYNFAECSLPAVEWASADEWSFSVDFSCPDPSVVGPEFGYLRTTRVLEVEKDGVYEFEMADLGTGDATAVLLECKQRCTTSANAGAYEFNLWAGDSLTVPLYAGRYFVRLIRPASSNGLVDIRLTAAR